MLCWDGKTRRRCRWGCSRITRTLALVAAAGVFGTGCMTWQTTARAVLVEGELRRVDARTFRLVLRNRAERPVIGVCRLRVSRGFAVTPAAAPFGLNANGMDTVLFRVQARGSGHELEPVQAECHCGEQVIIVEQQVSVPPRENVAGVRPD